MEESSKQHKKQFDWLKAYQFQKGQSGNPGGRPKKTMKVFAREFLESMSEEDRIEYFSTLDPELVWKMAEGNPDNKSDITSGGKPIIQVAGEVALKHEIATDETTSSPINNSQK